MFLAIGLFLGIAASSLLGADYQIKGNVDRRFVLLFALVGLGALFGTVAIAVGDPQRREVALILAGCCGLAFTATGFMVALGSMGGDGPVRRVFSYSTDEVLLLANAAERNGQYEMAIQRLEELQERLDGAAARKQLQERIKRLQSLQGGLPQAPMSRATSAS